MNWILFYLGIFRGLRSTIFNQSHIFYYFSQSPWSVIFTTPLTPKGLWIPCMKFRDFGNATMIPICNLIFWNFFGGWEIERAFQQAITCKILILFAEVMMFSFFPFKWTFVVSHCHSSWICPKLPKTTKFVKFCLKTISLKNFKIPPKIEILI